MALNQRRGKPAVYLCMVALFLVLVGEEESFATSTLTNEPVAMVEHVASGSAGLSNFEYLYSGRVIDLGTGGSISLIYFQSCLRERILGGQVTIRAIRSDVEGALRLSRRPDECGLGNRQINRDDRRTSAAMVFRRHTLIETIDHTVPRLILPDEAQWVSITEIPSNLEIFRLQTAKTTVDLSDHDLLLAPGKFYRIETGNRSLILRIDANTKKMKSSKAIDLTHNPMGESANGYR